MRLICGPEAFAMPAERGTLRVILYGQARAHDQGSAGEAVKSEVLRRKLSPAPRAWDFLSVALSIATADFAGLRNGSPDGWTREFELDIAVADPIFWSGQVQAIAEALAFLTTDRWHFRFHGGGELPAPPYEAVLPEENCIALLSGGLDSLVGAIDLTAAGTKPFVVSQTVRGDADKQAEFAAKIGGGLRHLQLNHNVRVPGVPEASQRARSLIFIAFGVLAATTLRPYYDGDTVPLYVCENGFIAINPPLTGARLGSLSTRTAHPEYLGRLQAVLDAAGLRVRILNPYQAKTKGEMLLGCLDQRLLKSEAVKSTSCGRFQRKYKHCGRCVPCQVRRAAFKAWGIEDLTPYVYERLGQDDSDHAKFDDVRSVAMAIAQVEAEGFDSWTGSAFSSPMIVDVTAIRGMTLRGLDELKALHRSHGVR
jgi:7-cyano-7-deazaguanine synthase in queuosine biosynthesis